MGTNYYFSNHEQSNDPKDRDHIGKWSGTKPRSTFYSALNPLELASLPYDRLTIFDEYGKAHHSVRLLKDILEQDVNIEWITNKEFC